MLLHSPNPILTIPFVILTLTIIRDHYRGSHHDHPQSLLAVPEGKYNRAPGPVKMQIMEDSRETQSHGFLPFGIDTI